MGGQIRRGRIWRFWGAPIFSPEVPKYLVLKGFWGPLDGKSGRSKNAKFNHDGSEPPICGPLIHEKPHEICCDTCSVTPRGATGGPRARVQLKQETTAFRSNPIVPFSLSL